MSEQRRSAVATADPDEAAATVTGTFPDLEVSVRAGDDPFRFEYRNLVTDRFAVNRMTCRGLLRAHGPLPESISVGRRVAGDVSIRPHGGQVDTSRPFLRPIASSEFEMRDAEVMMITMQPAAVSDWLRRSGERGSLGSRVRSAPQLAAWGLVMDHAGAVAEGDEPLAPAEEAELWDLLCWSLLHAFVDPWVELRARGAKRTALRRAMRFLEEHADGVVTMPQVADAARVSVRQLQLLFRRELDTTPHRWLHDLRLDRARADLLSGKGTVAQAAAEHGMLHAGRFAADYRARFGEHPGTTLHESG